jgi:hypothetical protein
VVGTTSKNATRKKKHSRICRVPPLGDDQEGHVGNQLSQHVRRTSVKYLILMHVNPGVLEKLTPEQGAQIQEGHAAFIAETKERGEFIGTQALADPSRSKVVRSIGGTQETSDGPFVEAKEYFGGFYLVDVEDAARALELTRMIPDTQIEGLAVELRPVMFSDFGDM